MDGILISSLGSVERSWTKWAKCAAWTRSTPAVSRTDAAPSRRVAKLRPDLDSEAELKIIEEIEVEDNEGLTVLPGVLELLTRCRPDRWTVVTSATERLARVRMAAGGFPVPERLVTADQVTRGKPHPEPFLAGAALLGFAPEECVVFEDSASRRTGRPRRRLHRGGHHVLASVETWSAAHYLVTDLTGVPRGAAPRRRRLALRFTPLSA